MVWGTGGGFRGDFRGREKRIFGNHGKKSYKSWKLIQFLSPFPPETISAASRGCLCLILISMLQMWFQGAGARVKVVNSGDCFVGQVVSHGNR